MKGSLIQFISAGRGEMRYIFTIRLRRMVNMYRIIKLHVAQRMQPINPGEKQRPTQWVNCFSPGPFVAPAPLIMAPTHPSRLRYALNLCGTLAGIHFIS